jgi:sulfide dehydrogenase cytochrome subunit
MNTRTHISNASPPALLRVLAWSLAVTLLGAAGASLAVRALAQNATATSAASGQLNTTTAATISGEAMAHTCAACHGTVGRLADESFMPLAGMPKRQFVTTMIDFREGRRPATLMGHVAQGFSDAEIQAMAEFFATVPATGDKP